MLDIVQSPNEILRSKTINISIKDIKSKDIQNVILKMKETLEKEQQGVAIAAPQIGKSLKIFVVSGRVFAARKSEEFDTEKHKDRVYINPKITSTSKKQVELQEGCLSVRGKWGNVKRAERATIEAYDENAERITYGSSGLLAQIFQHEVDHLNGILYIDKATDIWDEKKNDEKDDEKK
jgi:peptide deformylase